MELEHYLSDKNKRRKKKRMWSTALLAFALIYVVLVGATWLLVRSPLFRVSGIVIEGTKIVPQETVLTLLRSAALRDRNFVKAVMGFRNILTWPSHLTAEDLAFDPRLEAVTLSKNFFSRKITVKVIERDPLAIWCSANETVGGRCYWFDDDGIVFGRTFDTQGGLLFAIHDFSDNVPRLGDPVLPQPFTPNFISIIGVLKASGIKVSDIILRDRALQEVTVATFDGPTLHFSLRFPADGDLAVLKDLMAKPGFGKLSYVDFRVEHRVYYK